MSMRRANFAQLLIRATKCLPDGFHRIRHYGLFANANRANNMALARRLLAVPDPTPSSRASDHAENGRDDQDWNACPCCGGRVIIVEAFEAGCQPRFWPLPSISIAHEQHPVVTAPIAPPVRRQYPAGNSHTLPMA